MDYRVKQIQDQLDEAVLAAIDEGKGDHGDLFDVIRSVLGRIGYQKVFAYFESQEVYAAKERLIDRGRIELDEYGTATKK